MTDGIDRRIDRQTLCSLHWVYMQPLNMLSFATAIRGNWKQEKRMGQIVPKMLVKLALPVSPAPAWGTSWRQGCSLLWEPFGPSDPAEPGAEQSIICLTSPGKAGSVWMGRAWSKQGLDPWETNWFAPEWKQFQGSCSKYCVPTVRNPSWWNCYLLLPNKWAWRCLVQQVVSLSRKLKQFLSRTWTSPWFLYVLFATVSTTPWRREEGDNCQGKTGKIKAKQGVSIKLHIFNFKSRSVSLTLYPLDFWKLSSHL